MQGRILVVDDEAHVRRVIRAFLEESGLEVVEADCAQAAEERYATRNPDAVILDYRLPDGNALDLMPKLQEIDPSVPIVILTGYGTIDLAVRAIQEGAAHFLTKPVEMPSLLVIIERMLEESRRRRHQLAQRPATAMRPLDPFMGSDPKIGRLRQDAAGLLTLSSPVLVVGEAGVGKGVLARWVHDNSSRAEEPLVHINCAGLTGAFLDAELFGYSKDVFPGGGSAKPGLVEVANHGTVFLDEIGELGPELQAKLLKMLDEGSFCRLGEDNPRAVDVRLIGASSRALEEHVASGEFSAQLFDRLKPNTLSIPALRERREDISRLASELLDRLALDLGRPGKRLSEEAMEAIVSYSWPGNLRELRTVLEQAVLVGGSDLVTAADLKFGSVDRRGSGLTDTSLTLDELEKRHIMAILSEEGGDSGRAATRLGVSRSTLYRKMKRHGLPS